MIYNIYPYILDNDILMLSITLWAIIVWKAIIKVTKLNVEYYVVDTFQEYNNPLIAVIYNLPFNLNVRVW